MTPRKLPPVLDGLRLRITVDDYEGHPRIPPGTVVNYLGDPVDPEFLVVELDGPIRVRGPGGRGETMIRHVAVSPYGWHFGEILNPPQTPALWFVKVWHVYDSRMASSSRKLEGAMEYVAKGGISAFIPTDIEPRGQRQTR